MDSHGPHLVLIESEPATRQFLEQALSSAGCVVSAAGDGETGLELIGCGTERCDVVLASASLPGIDGYDVCCVLEEYLPATPVILVCDPVHGAPQQSPVHGKSSLFITRRADPALLLVDVQASIGLGLKMRQQMLRARRADQMLAEEEERQLASGTDLVTRARSLRGRHVAPPCPECGSDRVIPIIYGAARMELLSAYAAGRVALGGARKSADAPTWQCRACDWRWSS